MASQTKYALLLNFEQLENRETPTTLDALNDLGMNMLGLGLTGQGINIAMIEGGRPGINHNLIAAPELAAIYDTDKMGNAANLEPVFFQRGHATSVASVMIAKPFGAGATDRGVVPNARLSAGSINLNPAFELDVQARLRDTPQLILTPGAYHAARAETFFVYTARTLSKITENGVSVVNASFQPSVISETNGASGYARMVDYMGAERNFLLVTASPNVGVPTNHTSLLSAYNSLHVGALDVSPTEKDYYKVMSATPDTSGTRSLVEILAPGKNINVAAFGKQNVSTVVQDSGTSYATPLVTSAVAGLTEYIRTHPTTVAQIAQHRYVLKAIILNSANKIEGELPGIDPVTLTKKGMARTIYSRSMPGQSWDAFTDVIDERSNNAQTNQTRQENALNPELGAGALDVRRAVTQINGGQNGRPLNVPANAPPNPIGWDGSGIKNAPTWQFNDTNNGQILRRAYELPQLKPGSYFSATLSWERPVTMLDKNGKATNGAYQAGFTFDAGAFSTKPPNLDLYLVKKGATTIDDAVWASTSKDNSVEHFFFQMPNSTDSYYSEDGYELWVVSREPQIEVPYGIAWWGVERFIAPAPREKLGGNAFNDTDGNGLRGPGEPTQAGVGVRLLDSSGSVIDSVKTDWQGNYEFEVQNGSYQIEFVRPGDSAFTQQNVGTDDTIDSDANVLGRTDVIVISNNDVESIDAGLVAIPLGTVSGRAFNDANGNGIQDANETGYAGVGSRKAPLILLF